MNLTSTNTNSLNGEIICPGDKSISQRILILGSLLNCDMEISGFLDANDPNSTLNALNEIGASINKSGSKVILCKRGGVSQFVNTSVHDAASDGGCGCKLQQVHAQLVESERVKKALTSYGVAASTIFGTGVL